MGIWTSKEIDILKNVYPNEGKNIPELLINHTSRSIQMKASELKIGRDNFHKWSQEELDILRNEYPVSGSNIPRLLLSRSVESIGTRAHRLNLHWDNYQQWSEKDVEFFKKNIKTMSAKEIAKGLGKKLDSVRYKASSLRISSGGRIKSSYIKNINNDFFKTWSEDMAYVLGFWFADGNISKELNRFSISSIDIELLNKIKKVMQSEHPLKLQKGSRTYTLAIGRKEMCKDVVSLGGTPRKSLTARFPYVPKEFVRHFIRGNFDGDGSVSLKYKGYPTISFLGTNDLLHGILNAVQVEGEVKKSKDANVHYLLFSGENAQRVLHYMYHESYIYLDRKHKRYLEAMRWMKKMNGRWTKEEDEILKKNYPLKGTSIDELLTNRPRDGIRTRANKLGINCELERKFWRNKP